MCQAFLEQLSQTPYSKEFRFICVDPGQDGRRPQLPGYVKAVPTLMIAGEPEPRVDNNVMNWLMERRLKSRSDVAPGGGFMGAATGMGGASSGGGGGPAALYANEMSGIGDEGFAMIGEEGFSGEKSTVRLGSTMTGINDLAHSMVPDSRIFGGGMMAAGGGSMGGGGPGTAGPTARQSEKAKAFDSAYQAFLADRDRGMPKGIQRI
jgi:hypothetical protein